MKITARTLAIEYARRGSFKWKHSVPEYTKDEIAEAAFFDGYKTAEKEWRKKLRDADAARAELEKP